MRRVLLAAAFALAACAEPIETVRLPKEKPVEPHAHAQPGHSHEAHAPGIPAGGGGPRWTLPDGWTEKPGGGMRFATLVPPDAGEISVVVLQGEAGGTLANVNRWRDQLGLGPIQDLSAAERVPSQAGTAVVFDFAGQGTRLVGAILSRKEETWFFKWTGPEKALGRAKPSFLSFVRALRDS